MQQYVIRGVGLCTGLVCTAICSAQTFNLAVGSNYGGTGTTSGFLTHASLPLQASFDNQNPSRFNTTQPTLPPDTLTSGGSSTGGGLGYIDSTGAPITVGESWLTTQLSIEEGLTGGPQIRVRIRGFATYDPSTWTWGVSNVFSSFGGDSANTFEFNTATPRPYAEFRSGSMVQANGIFLEPRQGLGSLAGGMITSGFYRVRFDLGILATPQEPTRSFDATYIFAVPAPGACGLIAVGGLVAMRRRRG
jgi:hypothetical protein